MRLRKNIAPKTVLDFALTVTVLVSIPVVYWFEVFVVLPTYYVQWSFWYNVHWICASFVLQNVASNYLGMLLCDTSIKGHVMPTNMPSDWRFCVVCESVVPPRSWHCETCATCILKRDHHCAFGGCCVGHHNARYFVCFVFYAFVSCVYATYFNLFFVYDHVDFDNYFSWLSFVFPLASFMATTSAQQFYILVLLMLVICCAFTGFLLFYHCTLVLNGQITHERNSKFDGYDYGRRRNIELTFGTRPLWCLLSATVKSDPVHDGIHWQPNDTLKTK